MPAARPLFAADEPGAPATMPAPARLPEPVPQQADEPRAHFAARLFAWVLAHGHAGTVVLSDDDLALAQYGARLATDARQLSPVYYDRVADAERLIAGALRRRTSPPEPEPMPAGTEPHDEPAGPMARLQPAPDRNPTPPTTYAPAPGIPAHLKPGARIQF